MLTDTDRTRLAELDAVSREWTKLCAGLPSSVTSAEKQHLDLFGEWLAKRQEAVRQDAAVRRNPLYGKPDWRDE